MQRLGRKNVTWLNPFDSDASTIDCRPTYDQMLSRTIILFARPVRHPTTISEPEHVPLHGEEQISSRRGAVPSGFVPPPDILEIGATNAPPSWYWCLTS